MKNLKIKPKSINKGDINSSYQFPREQKILEILRKTLIKLRFEEKEANSFGRPWEDTEEELKPSEEEFDLRKELKQEMKVFDNKDFYIDIIFFVGSILVHFRHRKGEQNRISDALEEFLEE